MAYEYSVYKEYVKDLPRSGEKITTPHGKGKVIDVNILKRFVMVDLGEGQITKVAFPIEK
jgi:cell fate regulator YaaT (PSP1 superfamily)